MTITSDAPRLQLSEKKRSSSELRFWKPALCRTQTRFVYRNDRILVLINIYLKKKEFLSHTDNFCLSRLFRITFTHLKDLIYNFSCEWVNFSVICRKQHLYKYQILSFILSILGALIMDPFDSNRTVSFPLTASFVAFLCLHVIHFTLTAY